MFFKRKNKPKPQAVAVEHCRSISDDEWRRLKRAVEGYRKADKVLSGEDTDSDVGDLADQIIET